jgi:hypothetical protein
LKEAVDHVKTELMPEVDFSQFESKGDEVDVVGESDLKWD